MADNTIEETKVAPVDGERKGDWPTASMRISRDELHLIDAAAYKLRIKRSTLIYDATMARVREVLAA